MRRELSIKHHCPYHRGYFNTIFSLIFALLNLLFVQAQEPSLTNPVAEIQEYLYSGNLTEEKSTQAFENVKQLAETGDSDAICLLGEIYKDGIGTRVNFNKALKSFRESAALGNQKAAYSIGYMYLKGLGNVPQDYGKAVKWFDQSNYPMAKHWLAKMKYFGFGMPMDKEVAIQMLENNPIGNSQLLLPKLTYAMSVSEESLFEIQNLQAPPIELEEIGLMPENGLPNDISGDWKGIWIEMDWSGEMIMRKLPMQINIQKDGQGDMLTTLSINGGSFNGEMVRSGNELVFPDLTVNIKKDYSDYPNEEELGYRLTSLYCRSMVKEGLELVVGNVESTITNWSEPAPPIRLLLWRDAHMYNAEILEALSTQEEHFIKVYPNPFEDELLLYYTLERDAHVEVKLYGYYNTTVALKSKGRSQKKGERTLSLGGLSDLEKGLYIVSMSVGQENYNRIVIKN